jgi:hypothetical protein
MKKYLILLFLFILSCSLQDLTAQTLGEKLGKNLRKGVEVTKEKSKNIYNKTKETSKSLYGKGKESWKNSADERQKIKEKVNETWKNTADERQKIKETTKGGKRIFRWLEKRRSENKNKK